MAKKEYGIRLRWLSVACYEIEFGGLKEGMEGILTYQGRYFVDFTEKV